MNQAVLAPPAGILDAVRGDLAKVADVLSVRMTGQTQSAPQGVAHLVESGGKRLRPALVCLVHGVFSGSHDALADVAAIAEYVHAATLAHDDVIDSANERRNKPTLHTQVGNHQAVLVGDFLFASAYLRLCRLGLLPLSHRLAQTIAELVEGELMQMERTGDLSFSAADYETLAGLKTGSLFGWCAAAGAFLATADENTATQADALARAVGIAYQITDDLLDLRATSGKDIALDLAEGKMTLPVIEALLRNPALGAPIQGLAKGDKNLESLAVLSAAVDAPEVRQACLDRANQHLELATNLLNNWPQNTHTEALRRFLESLPGRVT